MNAVTPSIVATPADLATLREARGWSIAEAAQRMRLAPRQVSALEQGDWSALPGGTFVRGALRGYGRMLGVGVEPLIEALGDAGRPSDLRTTSTLSTPMPRGDGLDFSAANGARRNRIFLLVATLAGVVAVALFFGRTAPRLLDGPGRPAPSTAGAPAPMGTEPANSQPTIVESLRPEFSYGGSPAGSSGAAPSGSAGSLSAPAPAPGQRGNVPMPGAAR
jgi:cytoskeleton protein RodZ